MAGSVPFLIFDPIHYLLVELVALLGSVSFGFESEKKEQNGEGGQDHDERQRTSYIDLL